MFFGICYGTQTTEYGNKLALPPCHLKDPPSTITEQDNIVHLCIGNIVRPMKSIGQVGEDSDDDRHDERVRDGEAQIAVDVVQDGGYDMPGLEWFLAL